MKKTIQHYSILTFSFVLFFFGMSIAQEAPIDTLSRSVLGVKSDIDALKRIKVSGYIQAQYQFADSGGIKSFAGGDFASGVDKRFMLRRGRVKFVYDGVMNDKGFSTAQYVFQIDVSEKGLTVKDLYAKFTDPLTGFVSVTAGMQNRPFGNEIVMSSSVRESPERGRLSQTIFPNERDLGAMLTIQGPKGSSWNWLKIDGGLFNGTGGPSAGANTADFDKYKDFIGHAGINKTSRNEKITFSIGASMYNGGYRIDTVNVYAQGVDSVGVKGFNINTKKSDVNSNINHRSETKRECIGFDAQISMDWAPGITTLRGEYIQGQQPGISSSSASPSAAVTSDIYMRKFNGAYFYFVQNIMQLPFQAIVKYDWYDPNTQVAGNDIGLKVKKNTVAFNATDIKYTTLGVGLAYRWDANVKITAYYDMVTNETSSNLSGWTKDLRDNVVTLRAQVKF